MKNLFFIFFSALIIVACGGSQDFAPKPRGYFRLEFPKKEYQVFDANPYYSFEYPVYAKMIADTDKNAQPCWNNLNFPQFNGQLHLTYHGVFSAEGYNKMTELARELAMKHTVKASAIDQKFINYPDRKVYGVYYAIEGNTASSVQFFLTDSTKHYFRGALYFNERPQYDSIQPVVKFIKKDIDKLIETFRWKD